MKIKVNICSQDKEYLEKLVNYFNSYYYDKFQWNIYTQSVYLEEIFRDDQADLILVGEEMRADLKKIDQNLLEGRLWVYLVKNSDELEDGKYIKKYQKADQIYRELLDLYAQKGHAHYESRPVISQKTAFIVFVSAGGGCGSSTIACAAAKASAQMQKVLYMNLENFGSCKYIFSGENALGFDELVYALKSRRNILALKLESAVSRDKSGVYFFRECTNPMDLQTLSAEDIKELLHCIAASGAYDKVIIDLGNGLQEKELAVLTMAGSMIMVTEQGEIAMCKLERYLDCLRAVEEAGRGDLLSKMKVYINKTYKNAQLPDYILGIRTGGAFPMIENGTYAGITDKIAMMELLRNIR